MHNFASNVDGNFLWDTLRGANEMIITNSTGPQYNRTGVTAFNSNGFTLGNYGGVNSSGYTYVSWNWKAGGTPSINTDGTLTSLVSANQAAGFSILKWNGNGTVGATVGHGLNAVPELFITKNIAANNLNWATYNVTTGNSARLTLNESAAANTGRVEWNSTTPTSSVVTFSDHPCVNSSGVSYIGYAFTSIPGYSKVGTYSWSGTSYTAGTMVTGLGFTPGLVIIKRINNAGNWFIFDNKRVSGTQSYALYLNSASAEVSTGYQGIILDADGFSAGAGADGNITGSGGLNENGGTYIYLAIKEN